MEKPFVDRIEGSVAVLVIDGRESRVPLTRLPPGVREGVYLTADLKQVDQAATDEAKGEVEALRKKLSQDDDGGDLSL